MDRIKRINIRVGINMAFVILLFLISVFFMIKPFFEYTALSTSDRVLNILSSFILAYSVYSFAKQIFVIFKARAKVVAFLKSHHFYNEAGADIVFSRKLEVVRDYAFVFDAVVAVINLSKSSDFSL